MIIFQYSSGECSKLIGQSFDLNKKWYIEAYKKLMDYLLGFFLIFFFFFFESPD